MNDNRLRILSIYLILASLFSVYCAEHTISYFPVAYPYLAEFTAPKPFVYRFLSPLILRGLHAFMPWGVAKLLYLFVCVLAILYVMRALIGQFIPEPRASLLAPLIFVPLLCNYVWICNLYYPSDMPAIIVFALALILIFKRKVGALYAVLFVGTLNRETAVLIVPAFFLLMYGKMERRQLMRHCFGLLGLWLATKACVNFAFRHNPGRVAEDALPYNYRHFIKLPIEGHPIGLLHLAALFGLLWVPMALQWHRLPPVPRRLAWLIGPFIVAMVAVGRLDESRLYNELVVIICLLASMAVAEMAWPQSVRDVATTPNPSKLDPNSELAQRS